MPFLRPTLQQLIDRIRTDIQSRLPGADAGLRRSVLEVIGRTLAGAGHGLHGHIEFIGRQILPDTAEAEFLERHASNWGIERKPAWPAAGAVTFTGTSGAVIPAGTLLRRADGAEFETTAEVQLVAGAANVEVVAVVPGVAGNTTAGSTLSLVSPIAGVQSATSVTGTGLTGGSDREGDASLLDRLLLRIQEPPHGGAGFDYLAWTKDKAAHGVDVTDAWVSPREMGIGTVTVRFMCWDSYPDGIPLQADLDAVRAHLEKVRPVTAELFVVAPIPVALNLEIAGLNPATQAVRDAVAAEVRDFLRREAVPGGTILISRLREAISSAAGEYDHRLVSPAADIAYGTGEVAVPGTITWS